ncbi:MAG TPA: alkaline phosphatase family protein, partial [Bacteroidota bacterium]
ALGMLVEGLRSRKIIDSVNVIVVSDHGMAPVEKSRTIWLDDYLNTDSVRIVDWGIVVSLWPSETEVDAIVKKLSVAHPHMKAFRKQEIPERFHYRNNRRIAPVLLIADEGWTITRRGSGNAWRRRERGGNHGYDNQSVSMRALFIGRGPAFKTGVVVEPFENIHLYALMCHLLGIQPAPHDGHLETVKGVLQ